MGGGSHSGVIDDPTACEDASIAGICSSTSTAVLALSGKKPPYCMDGGNTSLFFLFQLDLPEVGSDSESEKSYGSPQLIGVLLSCFCRIMSSFWRLMSLASSASIFELACANLSSAF